MTYFEAYLLTRLDSFSHFFVAVGGLSIVATIVLLVVGGILGDVNYSWYSNEEKERGKAIRKKCWDYSKIMPLIGLICFFINSLIPTTKEAAFIYIAPAIVNNQDIQKTIRKIPELSGLGLEYLSDVLKQEIRETSNVIVKEVKEKN